MWIGKSVRKMSAWNAVTLGVREEKCIYIYDFVCI